MSAAAERLAVGQLTELAERRARELYGPALIALARRGKVPGVALGHLAVRVLLFLLGQRPGYFAHQKVIAAAVESNLTSVRSALAELRTAGLVSWELIPPHHPLPTGSYTRTNVNRYYVDATGLLSALNAGNATPRPKTMVPTHRNSDGSTGTDPKFEQDPPLPPDTGPPTQPAASASKARGLARWHRDRNQPRHAAATMSASSTNRGREIEAVLAAWRSLGLGDTDDRSARALNNRLAEGATLEQLEAAVEGASANDWLRAGRAKVPFAIVFASRSSVERFALEGAERAREVRNLAEQRALERRRTNEALGERNGLTRAEYAALAARALKTLERAENPL